MKNTRALIISVVVVIWYVVVITIASELFKPFKTLLAAMTGYHWVTKSVLAIVLLGLIYFSLKRTIDDNRSDTNGVHVVVGSAVPGSLIIFMFYIWHFLA